MSANIPETHRDILEALCFGHVATLLPDGRISVHPVCVMWTDETVWFSTLRARKKVRNLERDDRMSLSIMHPERPEHYLELRGRGVVEDDPGRKRANQMSQKFIGVDEYPFDGPGDERVVIRMVVEEVVALEMPGPLENGTP